MSAQTATIERAASRVAVVRFDRLLALYAIVPLCAALVAVDLALASGALRRVLPSHPDKLLFFTVFVNLPHIVASHLTVADAEYLPKYRTRILWFGAGLLVVTGALKQLAPMVLGALAVLFTVFHICAQQVGLTGAQLRVGDRTFTAWKWITIASGVAAYVFAVDGTEAVRRHFAVLGLALLVPSYLLAARLHRRSATAAGRRYLWANQAMFTAMIGLGLLGYPIFAALMPRVVHDLTAFYVYGVHDHNRNRAGAKNAFYKLAAALRVPTWIAGPAAGILIALAIERALPPETALVIVYTISAFHYYLEGVIWKRGSPHREHVAFA